MCGIVGAASPRNIVPVLVEGLKRLEYRGYDSCGIAVHQGGVLRRSRSTDRVAELAALVAREGVEGGTGIAHTRWATHGAPVVDNAHPHFSHGAGAEAAASRAGRIALVHNGIIENHEALREKLEARGYAFASQTDTEVIAHLVDLHYDGDLFDAVKRAVLELKGAYAIAVFCRDEPHRVVGARLGSPLVLGIGEGETFHASDAMALAGVTDRIVYLDEGDVADLQLGRHWIERRIEGTDRFQRVEREVRRVPASISPTPLRTPAPIRDRICGLLSDPAVLFFHPWEFVDMWRTPIPLDCRVRTGAPAIHHLRETIRHFRGRGARFVRMQDLADEQAAA